MECVDSLKKNILHLEHRLLLEEDANKKEILVKLLEVFKRELICKQS